MGCGSGLELETEGGRVGRLQDGQKAYLMHLLRGARAPCTHPLGDTTLHSRKKLLDAVPSSFNTP